MAGKHDISDAPLLTAEERLTGEDLPRQGNTH